MFQYLFTLVREHVSDERIGIHASSLITNIENLDLRIYSINPSCHSYQELHGRNGT